MTNTTDPIIFIFGDGSMVKKPAVKDLKYKGIKINGCRPTLILYPLGVLNKDVIDNFKYLLHPIKGQILVYEPKGVIYK